MKKQDFVNELISHGQGFAVTVLAMLGAVVLIVLFLAVFAVVAFFDRLLH